MHHSFAATAPPVGPRIGEADIKALVLGFYLRGVQAVRWIFKAFDPHPKCCTPKQIFISTGGGDLYQGSDLKMSLAVRAYVRS